MLSGRMAMAAMSSLGLPMLAPVTKSQEAKTHVEEWLQGSQIMPVVAGEGCGRDCWRNGHKVCQALTNPNNKKYNVKYNKYDKVVLGNLTAKGDWGMCNLPRANTPQAIIGSRVQDNNTRTLRVRGSRGRRFRQALPVRVAEECATGTDRSLCHKVFVCSAPDAGAAARTSQQCMIGLNPDCTPVMTSLLHTRWQGVVAMAPLGAGISPVRGIIQRQTSCSL